MPDIPRIWTFGHLVALVELVAGIVGATWLIIIGVEAEALGSAGRSPFDRAFPFVAGAAIGVVLTWLAVRSRRAASRAAAAADRTGAAPRSRTEPAPPLPVPVGPLSPDGKREVSRVVAVLAAAGVFVPRVPAPEHLDEAAADAGEPVTAETVLGAIQEADWYRPGFHAARYCANLAFHVSHGEQDADVLRAQAMDIVRLSGGGLTGVSVVVEVAAPGVPGPVPTTIRVRTGDDDDDTLVLRYPAAVKYLSTVLHVSLARILHERGTGPRLAWLWSDQGVWLAGLRDGEVERLNAELGPAAGEGWAWVDEQPPTAAGDPGP